MKILSVDIGTSAVKILFFDTIGRAVEGHQYRREVELRTSRDGASEAAPDELVDIVWQGIDAVLAKGGPLMAKIAGVAFCTFVGNIMGSTTAIRAVVEQPIHHVPSGLWCYRIDGRRSLPGGALSEGGSLFAWMKNTLRMTDASHFEAALNSLVPDGHGLTVLPFLTGERSPGWRGHARATIHGISQATKPFDILQAGMEAVACRIALVFKKLAKLLPDDLQIVAGGGAIHNSPAWLQIITDMLNRSSIESGIREGSARGAALLAFEALGLIKDLKNIPLFIERTCYPNEKRHTIYRQTIRRQQRLYEKLIEDDR